MANKLFSLAVAFLFLLVADVVWTQGIGDRLLRTAVLLKSLPLTSSDATSQGWTSLTDCQAPYGIPFSYSADGPSKSHPTTIYFTSGGQIAGVAVTISGTPPQNLLDLGYWQMQPWSNGRYSVSVSFRDPAMVCSGETDGLTIGDRLVVAQIESIPLNSTGAEAQNWFNGSCLPTMGRHWGYDLSEAPAMSWTVENLIPVLPMYNPSTGNLHAFLIETPTLQLTEPFGEFENNFPMPLWCLNFCSWECLNTDAITIATLHFFLHDPNEISCPGRCP